MITYNQGEFISTAIENVLRQQTNFPFKLVIGDDHSTDSTKEICREFISKYPLKIIYYCTEKNVGISKNFIKALTLCEGKYIAFCEGDDFWTDSNKLQKQVDYLENNSDTIISFHNFSIVDRSGNRISNGYSDDYKIRIDIKDLILGYYPKTCTVVLRRGALKNVNFAEYEILNDTILWFMLLQKGGLATRLPENMSSYRLHGNSSWSSLTTKDKLNGILERLIIILTVIEDNEYSFIIHSKLVSLYLELSKQLWKEGNNLDAIRNLKKGYSILFKFSMYNKNGAIKHLRFYYLFIKRLAYLTHYYLKITIKLG